MRGLALGLYRDSTLLGIATFSRVARPRWAAENFVLLPSDRRRNPEQRRHLTVTEAEYAALSRFALAPEDTDGRALGNGAATWFLCRCLAGLEARNRLLWTAQQRVLRGLPLRPEHIPLLGEAAGADQGRGRGYLKAVVTWADPYEGMIGHIYQVLNFHYAGRTNGGSWNREAIGRRSGRRLSARTLAKARRPGTAGHVQAALRIAWEGGDVAIEADGRVHTDLSWVRSATPAGQLSEHEISGALRSCWSEWRHRHVAPGAEARCRWDGRSGTIAQRFPPKHTYLVGLGSSAWYRRHTEMRFRALTPRLLAEEAMVRRGQLAAESRRGYYPTRVPADELKEELRHRVSPHKGQRG